METVFKSANNNLDLLNLNKSYYDFRNSLDFKSQLFENLDVLRLNIQEYLSLIDYYSQIKNTSSFQGAESVIRVRMLVNKCYASYLPLLQHDDIEIHLQFFSSVRNIIQEYYFSFIPLMGDTFHKAINKFLSSDEHLIYEVIQYVYHRSRATEIEIYKKFSNFHLEIDSVLSFIKYAINDKSEFDAYMDFLILSTDDMNWIDKIEINSFQEQLIKIRNNFNPLVKQRYFQKSKNFSCKKQIFNLCYDYMIHQGFKGLVGFENNPDLVYKLLSEKDSEGYLLEFINPNRIPVGLILKILVQHQIINNNIRIKIISNLRIKSPKLPQILTYSKFLSSLGRDEGLKNIVNDFNQNEMEYLKRKYNLDLTIVAKLVKQLV